MTLQDAKRQIVDVCQRMDKRRFVANHDGNVSVKINGGFFLATPTSFAKADVKEEDLLIVDAQGKVLEGRHKVFSEISWHLNIYKTRPDVTVVVHGHPPTAMGFSIAGKEIGVPAVPEAIVSLGRHILTMKNFLSGPELDLELNRMLAQSDAFLVEGNGVWTVGESVLQTYLRLELVEQIARAHGVAEQLGGARDLAPLLVDDLLKKRPNRMPTPGIVMSPSRSVDTSRLREIVRSELKDLLKG